MPVLGFPQAGMMPDPCRRGGARGARKPGTRGWRHAGTRRTETRKHAGRRHRSTQDGDAGTRKTETRKHTGRRHRSTQDGDAGTRKTETRKHTGRRHRSTQDGDAGTRKTETRKHTGRRPGNTQARRRKWARSRQNCGKSGRPPTLLRPGISPVAYTTNKRPGRKNDRAPF